jgi:hypothetical protein
MYLAHHLEVSNCLAAVAPALLMLLMLPHYKPPSE